MRRLPSAAIAVVVRLAVHGLRARPGRHSQTVRPAARDAAGYGSVTGDGAAVRGAVVGDGVAAGRAVTGGDAAVRGAVTGDGAAAGRAATRDAAAGDAATAMAAASASARGGKRGTDAAYAAPGHNGPMPQALLIIDYQNDFIPPDGALAVAGGDAIVDRINALAGDDAFDLVVATRDWHPPDHASFRAQGGPWPPHCVQGTPGAELSPRLDRSRLKAIVDVGVRPEDAGYSGLESPRLHELLREHGITAVTVVGLATDYCVLHTARDAIGAGLEVTVDTSAVRPVEVEPGDGERALAELERLGARIADLSTAD